VANAVNCGPVWDRSLGAFVGMLSITDVLRMTMLAHTARQDVIATAAAAAEAARTAEAAEAAAKHAESGSEAEAAVTARAAATAAVEAAAAAAAASADAAASPLAGAVDIGRLPIARWQALLRDRGSSIARLLCAPPEATVIEAVRSLLAYRVHRLAVVTPALPNTVLSVLTQHRILAALLRRTAEAAAAGQREAAGGTVPAGEKLLGGLAVADQVRLEQCNIT